MTEIAPELQTVLDEVAESAARVCGAIDARVLLVDGGVLTGVVAHYGPLPVVPSDRPRGPLSRASIPGRAILDRRPVHIEDAQALPEGDGFGFLTRASGARTILAVPMLLGDEAIGALRVSLGEVQPFSDDLIRAIQTFADFAATAIERGRLAAEVETRNRDLAEALDQQMATARVLEIIAHSPVDLQPVLDAIAENAAKVCGANDANIRLIDGDDLVLAATYGKLQSPATRSPLRVEGARGPAFRAIFERRTDQVADALDDNRDEPASTREHAVAGGYRAIVSVPLLKASGPIGAIQVRRAEPGLFSAKHVQLLEAFAAQAVIAIENARLFQDLQESLERQTATAEVLNVIASAPADVQPVFEAIAERAARLGGAAGAGIYVLDANALRLAAQSGAGQPLPLGYRMPLDSEDMPAVTFRGRKTVVWDHRIADAPGSQGENYATVLAAGLRHGVQVPFFREGEVVGVISVRRTEDVPFTPPEVALVETFAAQAVIAIENARLFHELEEKTREQAETLEEQAATNHILEIISQSPTDVQPVLDAIVAGAAQVCQVDDVVLVLIQDEQLAIRAHVGPIPIDARNVHRLDARLDDPDIRYLAEHGTLHIPDVLDQDAFPRLRALQFARSIVMAPLRQGGRLVGWLAARRAEVRPFNDAQIKLLETFADQGVIAIQNVRLFHELEERNGALREALEHQTATAEVLSIISRSPTDVQPVLDALCESAARVCNTSDVLIRLVEGDGLRAVAHYGVSEITGPLAPLAGPGSAMVQAFLEKRSIALVDAQAPEVQERTRRASVRNGTRSRLDVPLVRQDEAIGLIEARRSEVRPFTPSEIKLLETFADQAVIAIENARLFDALQQKTREQAETLEEQAATNHILEIISQSPTDVQPVLDAIVESAGRVCEAEDVVLHLVEGDQMGAPAAHAGPIPLTLTATGLDEPVNRWLAEHGTLHVPDGKTQDKFPSLRDSRSGARAFLNTPLKQGTRLVGRLALRRMEPRPFTERQIKLIETFADQAVIAIENVRLFHEIEERNAALREALEHQTATAEVLSIISRSPTDVQPVLDAICESAARVVGVDDVVLRLAEGDVAVPRAHFGSLYDVDNSVAIRPGGAAYRTIRQGETVHYTDMLTEGSAFGRGLAEQSGVRTTLAVPLSGEGRGVGYIVAHRTEVQPFTDAQIKLLETFADQAVIALENVRLFEELQALNADLTESLAQQTATAEVLEVMSAAPEQLQLVLEAVAERATRVCNAADATIYIEREGVLRYAARFGAGVAAADEIPVDTSRMSGQAFAQQRPIHVPDALAQTQYTAAREAADAGGPRAYLAMPLVHEGQAEGVVLARRLEPEPFTDRQIELLKTFADQAAIAVTLSRLIEEIGETNGQLEIASRHKSEFLANMSHELRTPLNAIIGFSEILHEDALDAGHDQYLTDLQEITSAGKHLLGLINDILDLSKVEAGRMDLYLEDFDIALVAYEVESVAQPLMEKNGNTLVLDVPNDLGAMHADHTKVRQCLLNLLSNAAKFTQQGTITLSVARPPLPGPPPRGEREQTPSLSAAEERGDTIVFSVSDTGIGMTDEQMGRLFEAFSQADASTTRKYGGTGLGLAISRQFCRMMGGDITVKSTSGQGSKFTITLPIAVSDQPSAAGEDGSLSLTLPREGGGNQ